MAGQWATTIFQLLQMPYIMLGAKGKALKRMKNIIVPTSLLTAMPAIIGAFDDPDDWTVATSDALRGITFLEMCNDASNVLGNYEQYERVSGTLMVQSPS